MTRLAALLARASRSLEGAAMKLSVLLLAILLVLMNVEVVGRYLVGYSTLIADEYGGYIYTWIVLLGAVHLLRSDKYLTMTVLTKQYLRLQTLFGLVSAAVGLAVSVVSLYAAFSLVRNSALFGARSIQPSSTPLVFPQAILPVGYGLLCLAYVEEILRRLLGLPSRRGDDEPETYGAGEVG